MISGSVMISRMKHFKNQVTVDVFEEKKERESFYLQRAASGESQQKFCNTLTEGSFNCFGKQ